MSVSPLNVSEGVPDEPAGRVRTFEPETVTPANVPRPLAVIVLLDEIAPVAEIVLLVAKLVALIVVIVAAPVSVNPPKEPEPDAEIVLPDEIAPVEVMVPLVVRLDAATLVTVAAPVRVRPPNVGVEAVWMFCGRARVILPAPPDTVIWFAVPVRLAATGAAPVEPMRSWPFVSAAASA